MDARLDIIMYDIKLKDNSFKEKPTLLTHLIGGRTWTQNEVREIWLSGIRHGLEQGLFMASLEGQRIEINNNMSNERHKEFYEKFLTLAESHGCAIQYHPDHGMCIIDVNKFKE